MFDTVRNNKRIVQLFLVLITLPFAFWGVESYMHKADSSVELAVVGGERISRQELRAALTQQQERLRTQFGGKVDPALFESPEMQRMTLDSLVRRHLLAQQIRSNRFMVADAELAQLIATNPEFQENGKFSAQRYEAAVNAQGMTKEVFEARLRQQLTVQQVIMPINDAAMVGETSSGQWLSILLEKREIAEAGFRPEAYLGQVRLGADAAKKFYETNTGKFSVPEQVRAEYVELNSAALTDQVVVSDDEIKARYQTHLDQYKEGEMRRASHILILAPKNAGEAVVKAAREKAEKILAQLKKSPAEFDKLAKESSQDPGSAEKGGDLGWFARGAMVKPFEDAAFTLKEGAISDLVRSDFGFHVIRVAGVRQERVKPLEEVRVAIIAEIKRELGPKKFAEKAEAFGNTVYEQADSLVPAAEKWKLPTKQTGWLAQGGQLPPPFDNPKLATALFSEDAIKNKHNTEAVEVAPGVLVAARVIEVKPASVQPFETVKPAIERYLQREEALKLAARDGEQKLAQLGKGDVSGLTWSAPRTISRIDPQDLNQEALHSIFKMDVAHLPAYTGLPEPGNGYVVFRVTAVKKGVVDRKDSRQAELSQRQAGIIAEEEFSAWLETLKDKFPVKVNQSALESKEH